MICAEHTHYLLVPATMVEAGEARGKVDMVHLLRTGFQLEAGVGLDSPNLYAASYRPTAGTSCEMVPSQVALGGPRLALRHLLPDHRA